MKKSRADARKRQQRKHVEAVNAGLKKPGPKRAKEQTAGRKTIRGWHNPCG